MALIRRYAELTILSINSNTTYSDLSSPVSLPFLDSVALGFVDEVNTYLNDGVDANSIGEKGVPTILLAAYFGHVDVVKSLVDAGADVNIKTENGMDALKVAAYEGKVETVRFLLKAGAVAAFMERLAPYPRIC